jgi:hypothetical protein
MEKSIKNQFNNLSAPHEQVADRLQEILDYLPQKLAALAQGKDIIKFLVPANNDALVDRKINDIKFAFLKELVARNPSLDCTFTGKISDWGDFLGINIFVNQKSFLAAEEEQGRKYQTLAEYNEAFFQSLKLAPTKMKEYVAVNDELSTLEFGYIRMLSKGSDPNAIPADCASAHHRTWYVDMPAWEKPSPEPLGRDLLEYIRRHTPKN